MYMSLNLRKGALSRRNWKLICWCHVIVLLLLIRMVVRPLVSRNSATLTD